MREEVSKAIRNLVKLLDDIRAMEAQLDRDVKALGNRAIAGPRLPSTRAGLDDYWRRVDPDGMRFVIRTCRTRITVVRGSVEELLRSIDHEVPARGACGRWRRRPPTTSTR